MQCSVASSIIAIVLLASGIEAITPYNSGAGNIYKLPVTQVQLVTLLIKCLSNEISFSRMCVLKGVHQTSTISSTLLLALTQDIPLNDLYCSFKIFHLHVEISSGQKCMFTLPMHTKLVSCLCHKCRTSPDHCKFTRYNNYHTPSDWKTNTFDAGEATMVWISSYFHCSSVWSILESAVACSGWHWCWFRWPCFSACDYLHQQVSTCVCLTLFTFDNHSCSPRPSGFVEIDITRAMRNWQRGDPNYGVVLLATNERDAGRDIRFYSNASGDSKKHAFVNVLCH